MPARGSFIYLTRAMRFEICGLPRSALRMADICPPRRYIKL